MDRFCYLGSILSSDALVDDDIQYSAIKGQLCLRPAVYASLKRSWHPTGHRSCRLQGSRLDKQVFYSQLEHGTRSRRWAAEGHAKAQSEGVQYRSEGTQDISRGTDHRGVRCAELRCNNSSQNESQS